MTDLPDLVNKFWTHLFQLLNLIPQGVHHIHQTPWKEMFLSGHRFIWTRNKKH